MLRKTQQSPKEQAKKNLTGLGCVSCAPWMHSAGCRYESMHGSRPIYTSTLPKYLPAAEPCYWTASQRSCGKWLSITSEARSWSWDGLSLSLGKWGGWSSIYQEKNWKNGWGNPGRLLATPVFFQVWNCLGELFPDFHRKEGFYSRRFSVLWIQPLPRVTQTFTCRTAYMFSSSGAKTCLETSGPGKKKNPGDEYRKS